MFVLYYSNAKYLFLQTRNGLSEDSHVFGGCHLLSRPPSLPVRTLKTRKHPRDIIEDPLSPISHTSAIRQAENSGESNMSP